jgi:hypothetical protein
MLLQHLYESFGFLRAGAELRKIHFAEVMGASVVLSAHEYVPLLTTACVCVTLQEWNEMHHLQVRVRAGGGGSAALHQMC